MSGWRRGQFARAMYAGKVSARAEGAVGHVLAGLWGLHRDRGLWRLTHLPTGMGIGCSFDTLAEGKRFADELSAAVNCKVGVFGVGVKGRRGGPAFVKATRAKRLEWGFDFVVRPGGDRLEWDEQGRPKCYYPPTRRPA